MHGGAFVPVSRPHLRTVLESPAYALLTAIRTRTARCGFFHASRPNPAVQRHKGVLALAHSANSSPIPSPIRGHAPDDPLIMHYA